MVRPSIVVVAAVLLSAGACGGGSAGADDDRIRVVASLAPLAEVAREVGGDSVAVTDLTPSGGDPHDLELTTDQMDALLDADVILLVGGGFQPSVEDAARRAEGDRVELVEEGEDPHAWLDPRALAAYADAVRARVAAAGAEATADHVEDIRALDEEFRRGLADCDRRVVVTAHDAFASLERYGLETLALAGVVPESEADPRRVAELTDRVRAEGVTTVFAEAGESSEVAETLAREAGVGLAVLDPIERLQDGDTYLGVMRENLGALRTALGCR